MSCYHPNLMWRDFKTKSDGTPIYHFIWDADNDWFEFALNDKDGFIQVPCGKCLGCRLDYSRRWADRMMLELESRKKAIFITLTYDDEHLHYMNGFPTLCKRDAQLFMKMLRRRCDGIKLSYYLCGEYGDKYHRPHMHAIIFGLSLEDFPDRFMCGKSELGYVQYRISLFEDSWHAFDDDHNDLGQRGFVTCTDVTWECCAYVARYVVKKALGSDYSLEVGVLPEFVLMSRNPGIGSQYFDEHPDLLEFENINISTTKGARKISIPKYFLQKVKLTDKELYDKISEERRKYSNDKVLSKLQRTSLRYLDQLKVEEEAKKRSVQALSRSKV